MQEVRSGAHFLWSAAGGLGDGPHRGGGVGVTGGVLITAGAEDPEMQPSALVTVQV